MNLSANKKPRIEDQEFTSDLRDEDLSRKDCVRLFAVGKTFRNVSFKQSTIESCYFRNSRFIKCDFTGASIKESNFKGAQFEDCNFKYTAWEKTYLDEDFLATCLPSEENLARDLVRSLRVNFTEIGNYEAVNRAASIEVQLTGKHLSNAAYSQQSYYRSKYKGWSRVSHAFQHMRWKALDLLWGNGESVIRILMSSFVAILFVALLYMRSAGLPFEEAFIEALWHFWGKQYAAAMKPVYVLCLTVTQFIAVGLFMAILVKRLSRR